jgi:hypothetical protein
MFSNPQALNGLLSMTGLTCALLEKCSTRQHVKGMPQRKVSLDSILAGNMTLQ